MTILAHCFVTLLCAFASWGVLALWTGEARGALVGDWRWVALFVLLLVLSVIAEAITGVAYAEIARP